jgi:hypothetical protein
VPHPQAVRHILDRRRRQTGRPPSIPVVLPDDPRVRGLAVRPHDLSGYDPISNNCGETDLGAEDGGTSDDR